MQAVEQTRAGLACPALPVPLTSFVGRDKDTAAVAQLLRKADVRLVSLKGPGGVGKTRLALEVAARLQHEFADGVGFVPLASISDPQLLLPAIAQVLGLSADRHLPIDELLQAELHDRQLLLVLDNVEQMLPAAPALAELLAACPRLKLLATSRSALHLCPEHRYAVDPLAYPDPQNLPPGETLSSFPAVELFVQRARAINTSLPLDAASMVAIAGICARLDGLPLAIELAAARVNLLSPRLLLANLEQPLDLLTQGEVDRPARQQSLRATLDWSYHLLDDAEQQLFRRLAVFHDGCSLSAAEAVCAVPGQTGAAFLNLITSLIDQSLVLVDHWLPGEARLRMLDTIRAYGVECLAASGELEVIQHAHAAYEQALGAPCSSAIGSAPDFTSFLPADCAPVAHPPAGLTRREFEVLRLLAAGHSNAAIAARIVVSNATVRAHLVSVYRKLDVSSRTEAMRYAIDHHLA